MIEQKQYKGIVVSHTHWDRAWYWTFEQFRIRLVQSVDQIIDILNSDLSFRSFMLDGQTVVLEDYLEIKPERRQDLERLVNARKLFIGPWYVLPDEFLVSGEALIRNLMLGSRIAKQFGNVMKEGYVPDPFGHIGQLPQVLQGFNLRSFIFMRGMDERVEELGSEFWWRAPDGSTVLAIYQRDNYGNLACWGFPYDFGDYRYESPDNETAVENVKKTFASIKTYSNTPYLLFNNGIDHLPPQPEVPRLIDYVNQKLPDLKLSHGSLPEFVDAVLNSASPVLKTYTGELIGNHHHPILLSVYSTRMYLKTANAAAQNLLERYAEPIAAFTAFEAKTDFTSFVWQAWKELLKNHPHDDICGCGIDEIHRDNVIRFDHVRQIGEYIRDEGFHTLARSIDTASQEGKPIVLYNPMNWNRTEAMELDLLFTPNDDIQSTFELCNAAGVSIPFVVCKTSSLYRMEVLKEAKYEVVTILATVTVPACGYTTLFVRKGRGKRPGKVYDASSKLIENNMLSVQIHSNGTLTVTDKSTGQRYRNLLLFEDTEDAGDEYTYSWIAKSRTITTKNSKPVITLVEHSPLRTIVQIAHTLRVPAGLNSARTERRREYRPIEIVSTVTLRASSRRLDISTRVTNTAADHRLRVLFPTGTVGCSSYAGGHFDVVERQYNGMKKPTTKKRFEYYSTAHHQEFVSVSDGMRGITIANKGLPEYEIVKSTKDDAIALTLLRCVGQLSRNDFITRPIQAGPQLPTPEAQCIGTYTFEYSIIPHEGNWFDGKAYIDALNFTSPVVHWNVPRNGGTLPVETSFVSVQPAELIVSAIKRSEDKSGLIVRFYNITNVEVNGTVVSHRPLQRIDVVNLNEELIDSVGTAVSSSFEITVGPKKIVTLKLTYQH